MSNYKQLAAAAGACMLAGGQMAWAGPDDGALLQLVTQMASQGQNAQTAAQVNEYVDQNQDAISTILKGYVNYVKQIEGMTADDGSAGSAAQPQPQPQQGSGNGAAGTGGDAGADDTPNTGGSGAGQESNGLRAADGLRTSHVQPSGGLRTSHLAGYPSLPEVDPISSVTTLTAAQIEYAAQVQKQMQDEKQYLMLHPEGYTY
jgi:hypothetical protein